MCTTSTLSPSMLRLQRMSQGLEMPAGPKPPKPIAKVSAKKKQLNRAAKPEKEALDDWFDATRKSLTGTCQCGCGAKSQKNDEMYYKCSCCHILPKRIFKSVMLHPVNFVERAFFGGCHSVMDDTSMDNWPYMADWDDICVKFTIMEPYLTNEEKATKFYSQLKGLVDQNAL